MGGYVGRHRRHAQPDQLPRAMRGLADLIEIVDDDEKD